jgi:serine/threonine protein kinase/WD40 repeat protein
MEIQQLDEAAIFNQARKIEPPQIRDDYLREACGTNETLRARVRALLEVHEQNKGFLQGLTPGLAAAAKGRPAGEGPGTVIGPYKLLEQIGEGGFGVVFMAEQQRPIRRKVAMKVVKPGMDTKQVIARFEAERQALALMDHLHIAKVLDAGQTGSGRPYFVMDLVQGLPITAYCDENELTPHQRLELFVHVCQAVQHAHQKGIIHRDLKPSNVLVTLCDGAPTVKVIDFGIAKALGPPLTDKTLFTGFTELIGTPLYMSPEQSALGNVDVDTRSDIYSLGVLLYELLSGTTPFDKERLKQAGYDEMRRIIREEEPPKPSTRISRLGPAAATLSMQRKSDPARLSQLIRGELDWIVMKALEKDRNRRYETADAFAADVRRYLSDEPVQACPPSAWYRFRKFARRNKAVLALAAGVGLFVVLTAIGASVAAITLRAQQKATRRQLDLTRQAEEQRTGQLFRSLVAQARGKRLSRRLGQRFESLGVLEEATQLARQLNLPEADFRELRNEAIACLTLPDLRLAKQCPSPPYLSSKVAFDEKLERYAGEDHQGNVSVRQVAEGREICRFPTGIGEAWLDFGCDGRFLAAHDGQRVKLWKLVGPEPELIREESGSVNCAFSPDGRLFAVGHADGSIGLFDCPSGKPVRRLAPGASPPALLAFNPQGGQLAVASPTSVQVRDLQTGTTCAEFHYPPEAFPTVAWHPDGKTIAVFGGQQVVYLWEVATGKQTVKLEGFKNRGIGVTFNHAGDLLASTGWESMLRLWDPRTGQELFRTPGAWPPGRRFSPDDRLFAADQKEDQLRLWEVATSRAYRTLVRDPALGKGAYHRCAFSPNSRLLAARMEDGLGFWDRRTGAPLGFVRLDFPFEMIFEASGALLTNGSGGLFRWPIQPDPVSAGLVRIGPPQRLPLPPVWAGIGCTPDGRVVASAQFWGALVWRRDRPGQPIRLAPHEDARYVSVSPDGRWVATGSHGHGGVKVWDAATGRRVVDLIPPTPLRVQVGFSPDGKWLATHGNVCRLWAVDSWEEGPSLGEATGGFAFSSDGRLLALETGQGVVRLVAPDSGREYARLEEPNQDRVGCIAFSPDGTQLVVAGETESLHVWDLRAIRDELAERGLDWDLPPYPPAGLALAGPVAPDAPPLRVTLDLGELLVVKEKTINHKDTNDTKKRP